MYTDEMMHAATKIMQNRADQLGLDEDELMHYGRKGMKWNETIFTDEDRARGQAVRQQQAEERMNSQGAAARDAGESMRAIREGKAPKGFGLKDSGVQSSNIYFTPEGKKRFKNPYLHLEEGKDYTVSAPYDVPYEAEPNSQGGTSGMLSKGYGKEIQENLNKAKQNPVIKEQISKYGNQQPEKNDEQRIAEKARGQYIREEQKKQRQDELNKKKQELLEKAKAEKEARENGVAEAKRKSELDEKKNALLTNVRGGSKSNHGSGYNGSDVPGRAVIEGKSGSNYWLGNGSFNGDDPLEYEYATNDTGYTRRHKK